MNTTVAPEERKYVGRLYTPQHAPHGAGQESRQTKAEYEANGQEAHPFGDDHHAHLFRTGADVVLLPAPPPDGCTAQATTSS